MLPQPLNHTTTSGYLCVLIGLVAVIGDCTVQHTQLHLFQAVFDNATHALVGGLTWLVVCVNFKNNRTHIQSMYEIAVCTALSSLIDVDHFIAAKSLSLQAATSLQRRAPLHCSTFPFSLSLAVLLCSYFLQSGILVKKSALIVLTAFLSHHTRDATRRGYWFYPFGSTPPIPYLIYVVLTSFVIPYFICLLYNIVRIEHNNNYYYETMMSVI